MKNHFKYVMMGLTALVGAATLSGCSSNEEVDINPTYDPETGRVSNRRHRNCSWTLLRKSPGRLCRNLQNRKLPLSNGRGTSSGGS